MSTSFSKSLTPLHILIIIATLASVTPTTVNAAPSIVSSSESASNDIRITRNHGTQALRQRDPEALLQWADAQSARLKAKHKRGRNTDMAGHRKQPQDSGGTAGRLARRQQGYEELHNLYSDTEVGGPSMLLRCALLMLELPLILLSCLPVLRYHIYRNAAT
jgi:hypothetical protein